MTLHIVLIFDDFSEHFAKVADVLKSAGIKGVFFINTAVIRSEEQDLVKKRACKLVKLFYPDTLRTVGSTCAYYLGPSS